MKTIIKTNEEISSKKSASKCLIVIISIALLSISLNAQEFNYSLSDQFGFNETVLALSEVKTEIRPTFRNSDVFVTYYETETEEALQLEKWMMDENHFSTFSAITEESESPLELETWMTNESFFNPSSAYLQTATEETLELESWMLEESTFSNTTFKLTQETETALELEDWMLNENLFSGIVDSEKPLVVEHWMVSEKIWN